MAKYGHYLCKHYCEEDKSCAILSKRRCAKCKYFATTTEYIKQHEQAMRRLLKKPNAYELIMKYHNGYIGNDLSRYPWLKGDNSGNK